MAFLLVDIFWVIFIAIEVPQFNGSNTPSGARVRGAFCFDFFEIRPWRNAGQPCLSSFVSCRRAVKHQAEITPGRTSPVGLGGIRCLARMPEVLVLFRKRVRRSD